MQSRRNQSGNVGHVHHQFGSDQIRDPPQFRKVDRPRIGACPRNDQGGLVLFGQTAELIVINRFGLLVDSVRDHVVELAAEVHPVSVGQMTAVIQAHRQNRVARIDEGEVGRHVRLRPGVRLDVCGFRSEQTAGAFDGDLFHFVDKFAAVVIALGRIAFGIFVGQNGALRRSDRAAGEVFRGDQFDAFKLTLCLLVDPSGDFGIAAADGGDIGVAVFFQLIESSCMASADAGELRIQPGVDDFADIFTREIIGRNHQNVGAVVVAAGLRKFCAVRHCRADSVKAVRHHCHADAGAADQDAFFNFSFFQNGIE